MSLERIATELSALRRDVGGVKSHLEALDRKVEVVDTRGGILEQKIDGVDSRMRIGFEETHRLIKMSLESVQILDEKIDRRFNETERQHADHKTLIEAAIGSLGRDVRSPAGPASRRRR